MPSICRQQQFRSLRDHQYGSDQKKILNEQCSKTTARVVSVAYRLWLPFSINRMLNLTKIKERIMRSICRLQLFRSLRAHQYISDQKKILKEQSAQTNARVVSVAYRLWLPFSINRVLNLTKIKKRIMLSICRLQLFHFLRAHQYSSDQKNILKNQSAQTTARVVSVAYHLWLPFCIHHWRISWSSYRKLIWVGFEPTTTEFRSDALTD